MNSLENQDSDNHMGVQDIRRIQFKNTYEGVKRQIKSSKNIIKSLEEERDIYHLNIWKEKLAEAENTLECFEFFISLFSDVIKETEEMNEMTPSENLRFKIAYIEAKKEVANCKKKVAKQFLEHNSYLTSVWQTKLSDAEHTLNDFEFFLSLFPKLKEFCYEESVILDG